MYMSNRDLSRAIQEKLKAAGIPRAAYSIRVRDAGYSTSVNIAVKDMAIRPSEVKRIAASYESIDYCQASGEILEGANTYVFVDRDYEALDTAAAQYIPLARQAVTDPPPLHSGATIMDNGGKRLLFMFEGVDNIDSSLIIFDDKRCLSELGRYSAYNASVIARGCAIFAAAGRFN